MSKRYKIVAPSGEVRENLTYQDVVNFKNAKKNAGKPLDGFEIQEYELKETVTPQAKKPYQQRRDKYGALADVFPYLADDYEKNGSVNSLGGAVRRGIAGIKDVASYPGRAIAGGMNAFINGDPSVGMTAEEAAANGYYTGAMVRDPFTAPLMAAGGPYATGVKGALKSAATGGLVGLSDALNRQEGYELDPVVAGSVGAIAGLAPYVPSGVISMLRRRIRNIDNMTMEELRSLANAALRGTRSKPLNDYETAQLIQSQPEVVDYIARNANEKALKDISEESAATLRNFGNTPIEATKMDRTVGMNEYLTRGKMGKTATQEETLLNEHAKELKAKIKEDSKNGIPKEIINEDKAELAETQAAAKMAKGRRNESYASGAPQLRQAPEGLGQKAVTDQTTDKFFADFNNLMDEAVTKMSSNWETAGGRLRRNSRGETIPGAPEQLGKRADEYLNMISDKVQARARSNAMGLNEGKPSITNQDIAVVLEKMAQRNEFEFMDALLDACTWITPEQKRELKFAAISGKASDSARDFVGQNFRRVGDNQESMVGKVVSKVPGRAGQVIRGIRAISESEKKFPSDFSKRYEAMQDNTGFVRNYDIQPGRGRLVGIPAGISVIPQKDR